MTCHDARYRSVTLSLGTPLCAYDIAYRRAYATVLRTLGSQHPPTPTVGWGLVTWLYAIP